MIWIDFRKKYWKTNRTNYFISDACADNPCSNGGICVDENGTPRCTCPTGFVGKNCETKGVINIGILIYIKKSRISIFIRFWSNP